jgi:3-oxoacyl-[acyl-carrier-protein] synthase-3
MEMDGRSVFKWAVRLVEDSSKQILEAAECPVDSVGLWLFHQANERILEAVVESMGIDREKVVMHLDRYGNTSTGSIPIALDESVRAGLISPGDRLLLCGFGAGLSWGTAILSW